MEQFNLDIWLQDKSSKVVTRRGNPVRIICTDRKHGEDDLPIVFLEESNGGEFLLTCRKDGRCDNYDTQYDLFFADEKEELTELQKTLEEDCDCYVNLYNDGKTREELREWIKGWCPRIIDLARKELEEDLDIAATSIIKRLGGMEKDDCVSEHELKIFKAAIDWQKQKDQETIELAEDHAMLAGMNRMKEEMMKDAVDAFVNTYENTDDSNYVEFVTEQSPYKFKETEKCKLIIVKEE